MIITIDGPAGAGKSTVAKALARRLGFRYLDTGAMYRAVALAGWRRGVDWQQPEQLADLARQLRLEARGDRILLDGEDVTDAVRTSEITAVTRFAADNPQIRGQLVELQRRVAEQDNVITEGRDQGTVVFPLADFKFFLTASPQQRPADGRETLRPKANPVRWRRSWRTSTGVICRTSAGPSDPCSAPTTRSKWTRTTRRWKRLSTAWSGW